MKPTPARPAPPPLLIQGGRVLDPAQGHDAEADLLLAQGRVQGIGRFKEADLRRQHDDLRVLNARGLWVLPGLVDLRAHLGEPGGESAETIASGAEQALAGGFTTVACTSDTDPPLDSEAAALYVRRQSDQAGMADVYPVCALTKGRQGRELAELGQLARAGAVAFCDERREADHPAVLLRGMAYASMFDLAVIEYAQDPTLASGAMNAGREQMLAGLPGIPSVAEELAVARACMFARETGCHFHAALVTTRNAVRAVKRARKLRVRVTAEVTPHHLCLTDAVVRQAYDTHFKVFPPLRSQDDIEWLLRGLREGVIDCIATGHRPVTPEYKELEFGVAPFGTVGLETTLGVVLTRLVFAEKLPLPMAIAALTSNPAAVLRLRNKGTLRQGADADVCVVDPKAEWTVDPTKLLSRCRNTAFAGMKLRGRARYTIARGNLFDISELYA